MIWSINKKLNISLFCSIENKKTLLF